MRKLKLFILLSAILLCSVYAQEQSPMYTWEYSSPVMLHGRSFFGSKANLGMFSNDTYADSYKEQDGYALIQGYKFHYWLYDTVSYHDGDAQEIYDRIIPAWVEGMGYVIDYDNIEIEEPNNALANSVRMLMKQRGAGLSVTLVTKEKYETNEIGFIPDVDHVVINEYFKSKEYYKRTVFYLYKDLYTPMTGGYKSLSEDARGQGEGWTVHLDLYWPKHLDDNKMQGYFNNIMQYQKERCSDYAANVSWIKSYISEYLLSDGTTYRIVSRYLYRWDDGDVCVYKGSILATAGTLMTEIYNSGVIKDRNSLDAEYRRQCDNYLGMLQ